MRFFKTEVWSYAVLLIILFCIASMAVIAVMNHIQSYVPPDETLVVSALIWSLTLGFMLIAGAFGLWAIKFSGEIESRRRLSKFVSAMDYLADPIIAVDRKGRLTGANPSAARALGIKAEDQRSLADVFPRLSEDARNTILKAVEPVEVEINANSGDDIRVLRLRAQPSEDLVIVQISDVTKMNARHRSAMYMARLQLIGQLARGVTHDLTNLFSVISGHASLLARLPPGSFESRQSVDAIVRSSQQGVSLAEHLLELAQPGAGSPLTRSTADHIRNAAAFVRDSLTQKWKVEEIVEENLPPVGMGGIQIEQMILNLALRAAETVGDEGIIQISAARPSSRAMFNVGNKYACVVLITASPLNAGVLTETVMISNHDEPGIIESVVGSMIEESGGNFFSMRGPHGSVTHRLSFPHPIPEAATEPMSTAIPETLAPIIARWNILLAAPGRKYSTLETALAATKARLYRALDIVSALAEIEKRSGGLDAIIVDKTLMGTEVGGIVRAIVKLQPQAGVVVLGDDMQARTDPSCGAVFAPENPDTSRLLSAIIEAHNIALRRLQQQGGRISLQP